MAAGFTQRANPTVAYPANVYPGIAFRGAGAGAQAGTGGGAVQAINSAMPAAVRGNAPIVLLLAVAGAWFLWHLTSGR